jgi:hypothetical protein
MIGDRLLSLSASESFPLSGREASIGALLGAHFPFAYTATALQMGKWAHS